jgi:hypothetical protein
MTALTNSEVPCSPKHELYPDPLGTQEKAKGLLATDAKQKIDWEESLVAIPNNLFIGKWRYFRRLDNGSPVSRKVHAGL